MVGNAIESRVAIVETHIENQGETLNRIEGKLDTHIATHRNGHTNGENQQHSEDVVVVIPKALLGRAILSILGLIGVSGGVITGILKGLGTI